MKKEVTKAYLDALWAQVEHIGRVDNFDYDLMVALGSVFGDMRTIIEDQQKEIEGLKKRGGSTRDKR